MKRATVSAICVIAILCSCLFIGGCSKNGDETSTTSQAAVSSNAATTKVQTKATEEQHDGNLNPYTGAYDMDPDGTSRPVGVMIGNNPTSRPQFGIETADLYFEIETEGSISRIMAVWASADRMPETVGPCRSARTPFVKIAKSLDLVYLHVGGSTTGKAKINELGLADIDGNVNETVFWRDQGLINSRGYEYSMMATGSKVLNYMKNEEYRLESNQGALFTFGNKMGDGAGNVASIDVTGTQTVIFRYDESTGLYTKSNDDWDPEQVHQVYNADGEKVPITVSNVLVLYAAKSMENNTTCDFSLSGDGVLITGGTSRDITYYNDGTGFSFSEADGSEMVVNPGKTYICVVNSALSGRTDLQ